MTNKTLSDKSWLNVDENDRHYPEKDVKEFIQKQFEIIEELLSVKDAMKLEKEFSKLAGEKLI